MVAGRDGPPDLVGRVARHDRERRLGPDPGDAEQELEQRPLGGGGEAVELERVLAHVQVRVDRDLAAVGVARPPHRRRGGGDEVADAAHVEHDRAGTGRGDAAAERGDHPATATRVGRARPRGVADRHGERVGRVVGGRRRVKPEDRGHHPQHLSLVGAPESAHRLLHLGRRIPCRVEPGEAARGEHRAAGLADREDRARVGADVEILERGRVGRVPGDELGDPLVDGREPVRRPGPGPAVATTPWSRARIRLPSTAITP